MVVDKLLGDAETGSKMSGPVGGRALDERLARIEDQVHGGSVNV